MCYYVLVYSSVLLLWVLMQVDLGFWIVANSFIIGFGIIELALMGEIFSEWASPWCMVGEFIAHWCWFGGF